MTQRAVQPSGLCENAGVAHIKPVSLADFAEAELGAATPWEAGVCFLPECGRAFTPVREWQHFCSDACRAKGAAEMRRWGHRLAMSALVWRMGKDKRDRNKRELANAAKRHMAAVLTDWMTDRAARAEKAKEGRA